MCASGTNTSTRTNGSNTRTGIVTTNTISTRTTFRTTATSRTPIRTCICRSRTVTRIFRTFITVIGTDKDEDVVCLDGKVTVYGASFLVPLRYQC